jgi:pyridoxal phosphate enzyme (YggS family)
MAEIAENLKRIQERIGASARRCGRQPEEVRLVAVSKGVAAERLREAVAAGVREIGENYIQEAVPKLEALGDVAIIRHFIGHLQKNKIRHALPLFELFHSIDSLELAQQVDRIADEEGARPVVLLEVNVAGEGSKFGFSPDHLRQAMEPLLALSRVNIDGVMAIPPLAPQPEDSRRYFVMLRELRDELEREFAVQLTQLSMGMSNDYEVAIEEGATLVRVGTAIFGAR